MVKRGFLVVLVAVLMMSLAVPVCMAADGRSGNDAWKKLGRGACNMLTFPLELFSQISRTNVSDGPMAAFTWGLLKGVGMTAFRAVVGVYETVTFPFPCPEGYKPILTEPEFFFEDQIV